MATQEIGVEQEDGRWNEATGAYEGEGNNTSSYTPTYNTITLYCRSIVEFLFHFLC